MIPNYQFASLSGDNIAKKRVLNKSKVAFETEEQRATKRGRSKDDANNLLKLIIQNLQLQITALNIAEASVMRGEETGDQETDIYPEIQSGFLGSMGKAITLAFQLKTLLSQFAPIYQNADVGGIAKMQGLISELSDASNALVRTVEEQQVLADVLGVARLDVERLFATYGKAMLDCELFISNILSMGYSSDTKDLVLDTVGRETELLFERLGIPYGEQANGVSSVGSYMPASVLSSRSGLRGLNRGRNLFGSQHTHSSGAISSEEESSEEESSGDESSVSGFSGLSQYNGASGASGSSGSNRSVVSGMGLSGGFIYEIPQYRRIHNMSSSYAQPIRYA